MGGHTVFAGAVAFDCANLELALLRYLCLLPGDLSSKFDAGTTTSDVVGTIAGSIAGPTASDDGCPTAGITTGAQLGPYAGA